MKSSAALKPDPPAIDVAAEYESALATWRDVDGKMKDLHRQIERRRLARNLAAFAEIPERSKAIAADVTGLIIASQRSPLKAASDIEALEFDLAELQPRHVAAHESYIRARGAMSAAIAQTFRERHLAATRGIVAAVDAVSAALQAEKDVRSDFAAIAPEATSCLLPDVASDLREMDLSRWDSKASIWARRVRNFGVLI